MRNKPDSTFLHLGNYVFDNITDVCVCVYVCVCVCVCVRACVYVFIPFHRKGVFRLQWYLGDTSIYGPKILCFEYYSRCFDQVP